MTRSRASLRAVVEDGETRALAFAEAPRRWTIARPAADGWLAVTHQLLGDGVFGGDRHRAAIRVEPGARLSVRAVAATPLRAHEASLSAVSLRVAAGGALLYLPGALVPHRGARHTNSLRIDAERGARVLAASVVVPGRAGMGERNAFEQLRLRTTVHIAGRLVLAEDATVRPATFDLDGASGFASDGAAISIVALGDWPPGEPSWWGRFWDVPAVAGGAGELRGGGITFRALAAHLGAAQSFLRMVEEAVRAGCQSRETPQPAPRRAITAGNPAAVVA